MPYTGPERRASGVTRRFVVILAALLVAYVSGVFWFASSRTSDGDLREASYENQLDSCERGNVLRAELSKVVGSQLTITPCRMTVKRVDP